MYSKKINQLATNLNPQETDLIPIGDAETGQLKTTTFNAISGVSSDGVISGGIVTWTGTGLNFNISACTYILNGVRYVSPFTTKTLATADPTNPRIDVFAVNTSGQVEVIQGTPNVNPVEPEGDTPTTLGLTNVTINAGATTPNGVTKDMIYDENVETWTKTQSVSGSFNYNDTAFPYTGSKALLVTMSAGFADFRFSKATAMDITTYKSLSFAIRLNTAWTGNTALAVQFYNGTRLITNTYQITATNTVGFNRNLAGTYQLVTIPLNSTLLRFSQNTFTAVRIYTFNAAATYRLDTISLNGGINNPTGGGTTSANSFGFVNGSTGSAASTQATDTLNVVGTGLATTSATGKTLTISVPQPTITLSGAVTGSGTSSITTTLANSIVGISNLSATGTPSSTTYLRGDNTWATISGGGASIGGTVTGGTTGSVLFVGASSALAQDNANFFWDDTNNRLGIGTNAPAHTLDINSTATIVARIQYNANVSSPSGLSITNNSTGSSAATRITLSNNASAFASFFLPSSTNTGLALANTATFAGSNDVCIFTNSEVASGGTGKFSVRVGGYNSSNERLSIDQNGDAILNRHLFLGTALSVVGTQTERYLKIGNAGIIQSNITGSVSNLLLSNNTYFFGTQKAILSGLSSSVYMTDGYISFATYNTGTAGGTITINSESRFFATGNWGLNTTTNAGFRLDVNGTARVLDNMTISKDQNAVTSLTISNATSGTTAGPSLILSSDTSAGTTTIAKRSTLRGTYKILLPQDTQILNQISGDIAILNDWASGKIKFAAGSSSTSHIEISTTGTLSVGTSSPNASAITQIDSTTKGFLPPRMTTTQKNAIATPAAGLQVYDTTLNQMSYYNGTTWINF